MAIALDSAISYGPNTFSGGVATMAPVITAADSLLAVAWYWPGTQSITSMTCNGTAMNRVGAVLDNGGKIDFFYIRNPAVGTASVVTTWSAGLSTWSSQARVYTGVQGVVEINGTPYAPLGSSHLTISTTTPTDGCWMISSVLADAMPTSTDPGTSNGTDTYGLGWLQSSSAITPAGPASLGEGFATFASAGYDFIVMSPTAYVPPVSGNPFFTMG